MTFTESIQTCFAKYATFSGRAPRSEYWWWTLFQLMVLFAAHYIADVLFGLAVLATLVPQLAVTARRLHDIGRSGWWQLVVYVPLIGWAVMIYWCVQESADSNAYD